MSVKKVEGQPPAFNAKTLKCRPLYGFIWRCFEESLHRGAFEYDRGPFQF